MPRYRLLQTINYVVCSAMNRWKRMNPTPVGASARRVVGGRDSLPCEGFDIKASGLGCFE